MKKKIIIGVSAAVIVIMAIAAGIVTGALSKKKSSNDINVSCKAAVTKNEDITCYDWLKKLCNKMGIETEKRLRNMDILQIAMNLVMMT